MGVIIVTPGRQFIVTESGSRLVTELRQFIVAGFVVPVPEIVITGGDTFQPTLTMTGSAGGGAGTSNSVTPPAPQVLTGVAGSLNTDNPPIVISGGDTYVPVVKIKGIAGG